MPDAEKIIEAAREHYAREDIPEDGLSEEQVIAAALRDAGMLTETEWEYGSEAIEDDGDGPRPLADDVSYWPKLGILEGAGNGPNEEQARAIVREWGNARLIRRRAPGPWEPVEGEPT